MSLTQAINMKNPALCPIPDTSHRITAILKNPKNGKPHPTTSFKLRKKNAMGQVPFWREKLWASDIVEWSPQCCASSLGANHCNCCRPKPLSPTVESSLSFSIMNVPSSSPCKSSSSSYSISSASSSEPNHPNHSSISINHNQSWATVH